jgi:hypothetical protein
MGNSHRWSFRERLGWWVAGLSLSLLTLVCCLGSLSIVAVERISAKLYRYEFPPSPSIAPEALLLPYCAAPAGWDAMPIGKGRYLYLPFEGANAWASRSYRYLPEFNDSWVGQTVVWYATEEAARAGYAGVRWASFADREPWQEMADWEYRGMADQWNLTCANIRDEGTFYAQRCYLTARYGQYLSNVNLRIVPGRLGAEEVQRLLIAADLTMYRNSQER